MLPDEPQEVSVAAAIESSIPAAIVEAKPDRGEPALVITPEKIGAVCRFLKENQQFVRLSGITAVDWFPMEPRFEVVYELHSLSRNQRLRLKCRLPGASPEIESVTSVWRCANWYEREVFDLFGVRFRGHPDPRRILMPADWEGYPLRKDFPVHGNKYGYQNEQ